MIRRLINRLTEDQGFIEVREMHRKFSFKVGDLPHLPPQQLMRERLACMREELTEMKEALDKNDLDEVADALVDLVYFALGTAVIMGLPWRKLWLDVHRANMSKVRGIGPRGFTADLVKPTGWQGPKTREIMTRANAWYTSKKGRGDD